MVIILHQKLGWQAGPAGVPPTPTTNQRTWRSNRISMKRAFRLLCVTLSSTVLSD